jgi:16S rRNA (guanine(966)-N(2))-methyltransferase RsmD
MAKRKKPATSRGRRGPRATTANPVGVRIIGGKFRGRKLEYSGDLRTRPMKDRVREALFNLLSTTVEGKVAIDLFAGTGALALEALSRGASKAVFIERHRPTAQTIQRNSAKLGVEAIVDITSADTFLWARRLPDLGIAPWLVFCSPPYEFYVIRKDDMLQLLDRLIAISPPGSVFAVEFDNRFNFRELPAADQWDIRPYPPAILGIWEKQERLPSPQVPCFP